MAEDEIEVLQAIYCSPAEFEVFHAKQDIGSSSLYTMKIKIKSESSDTQLKNTQTEIVLDAIFTMKPTYPNSIPDINLKSANLNQEEIEKLTFDLVQFANTLVGEVMVMEIVQWLQQNAVRYSSRVFKTEEKPYEEPEDQDNKPQKCTAKLETLVENVTSPDTQHLSARAKDNCEDIGKEIIVLQLDHMRSKAKYVKTICKWTEQLGLVGRLIFQGKNILIILEGTSANIRKYLVNHRTANVDIDSKGKSCKERMLSVLSRKTVENFNFSNFQVLELKSDIDVAAVFMEINLSDVYTSSILSSLKH